MNQQAASTYPQRKWQFDYHRLDVWWVAYEAFPPGFPEWLRMVGLRGGMGDHEGEFTAVRLVANHGASET